MPIDYSLIRNLTARELIRALLRDAFELQRQRGSHRRYAHPNGRKVTVPYHRPSGTFNVKTLVSMIEEQAGWTEDDLIRLRIMKRP
ncbi:MAG: type II toxin-antitoxin system HicA family toxin [Candidatus Poribacteria bacterium]|nr:type II toxin-antitoxin system HicA family toxin [Candidatus Poribacteria bacterium]